MPDREPAQEAMRRYALSERELKSLTNSGELCNRCFYPEDVCYCDADNEGGRNA